MKTVAEEWDRFRREVLPSGVSRVQLVETRRAFYAGAGVMLSLCATVGENSVSEDACVAQLESWHQELSDFAEEIKAGRA